jgi:outer membrane protein assembly factor BamB
VVRVLSGPKFHLLLPGSAVVSNGQLLVTTSGGDFGAMVVINASTGALDEVLDRTSCQFESPTVAQLDDDNVFVANNIAGITQLHAGRCVGAVEGSRYGFHAPTASAVAGGELFVVNGLSFPSLTSSITELNASTGALSRVITQPEIGFEDDAVVAKGNSAYVVGTFGRILQLNASTGAVTRQFNEPNAPFGPLVTGAVINGATIYESELHGGLLALNTATGRMQQLLSEPDSNSESTESDGLPVPMVVSGNDLFYLGSTQSGKVFVE